MVKAEYANAYKEVLDILKYVSKEDLNKIPTKKLKCFQNMLIMITILNIIQKLL